MKNYQQNGSYVSACFLDLRKAFDMVNHQKLFNKLVNLNFPVNMVKLLIYWYSNQLVNIRWKDTTTTTSRMTNGTRQGSLLSPYLFGLYIRGVSGKILNSGAGCHMGGVPCNMSHVTFSCMQNIGLFSPLHANNTDTCEWSCWWLGYGNQISQQISSHDIFARATQQKTVLYISRLKNWKWKSCFCWFIQVYWSLDIKWFVWWCTYIKTDGPRMLEQIF